MGREEAFKLFAAYIVVHRAEKVDLVSLQLVADTTVC